ncbi:DUF927 domain-containing protein [uncultured Ruminococcus sp.]|uniref:DUF927 domain-containing protein n=1 Tax=uncultured Ruminococcus sp. TaxID=165186 RepID=UPI0025CFEF72|nr:DUF927 domain-containing protein [uncultured Ruminococcus sp.]
MDKEIETAEEVEVIDPVEIINSFNRNDFLETTLPFDFLYKFRNDKFKFEQYRQLLAIRAKEVKLTRFNELYKNYISTYHKEIKAVYANFTEFEGQPLQLACGKYVCNDDICFEGKNDVEEVCNHPIMPVERLVNIDDNTEKLKLKYRKGFVWREIIVDKEVLASSPKIVGLARYGIAVNSENAKNLVRYLTDIENLNFDVIEEKSSVGRLGWINGHGFSPYVDDLVFDGDESFRTIFNSVGPEGDFYKWQELCKEVRAERNVCARIMLAASFASVLVEPCDCLPFFVHLWGGTESGKTVALMFATSVWASPSLGDYIRTFNSTAVAQELTAGFVNSLPLVYDELQIIKGKNSFDDIVYRLCEGIGKDRGKKTGGVQKILTWRNAILTTGEYPISNTASGAGAVNRIIEIDCKDQKIFKNPVDVVARIKNNYGGAGAVFVKWLQDDGNLEKVIELRKKYNLEISNQSDVTDKQAMSASLILTADELIEKLFFNDGIRLTVDDIKPFLVTKNDVDQNKRCYEFLNDFVIANYIRFDTQNNDYNGEIYGDVRADYVYIIKSKFDQILTDNGYNPRAFLSWAAKNGLLKCSKGRNVITHRIKDISGTCTCVALLRPDENNEIDINSNDDLPFD